MPRPGDAVFFDGLQEIYYSLSRNKLRTFLTAFGVFWGVFMLILLLGAGRGLSNASDNSFGSDDRTSIWISGGRTALPYHGRPPRRLIEFTEDDIAAIQQNIAGVQYISAENRAGERWQRTVNITYKNQSANFGVYGVADDFFRIKKYIDYPYGRTLNGLDERDARRVALVGTVVSDRLFGAGVNPLGKEINFHGIVFQVVGVFHDEAREGRMSERVYIPLSTFQKTFGRANKIGQITLTPAPGLDPIAFEEKVVALLRERHVVSPDDTRAVNAFNYARQMAQVEQVFSAIGVFIWFVGLGTLTAGIVGISNIMIITVKDRTREIGVRKALGATPASVVLMVLSESVLLTAVAGYLGLVLGVGLLELVNQALVASKANLAYFERPEVDLWIAAKAVILLVVCGALAGLAPAMRAAKILPIEAMREE